MGLASLKGPDGKDEPPLCCYFQRHDVVIHDTWRVSGLRATGSCDFEVRDLVIPEQHAHVFMAPGPTQDGIVYRLPSVSAFAWTVSVVPLGIARGMMNAFVELAGRKSRSGVGTLLRDREIVQSNYGRAEVLHRSARAFLTDAMSELMAALADDGPRLIRARVMLRAAGTHAAESAVRIADMLAAEAGAAAIFETSPIERFVRDVHAAVKHIAMTPNNYLLAGRLQLGLDPGTPRF
jgi:alkylation response protein AidB-like acyl-CoA dehydrogenase